MTEQQQNSPPKALTPSESTKVATKLSLIFKKWLKWKRLKSTPREEANQEKLTSVGVTENKSSRTPSEGVHHSRSTEDMPNPETEEGGPKYARSARALSIEEIIDKITEDELAAMEAPNPETKESRLAVRPEKEAIVRELTAVFGKLVEYQTMNMQEQTEEIAGLRKKLEEVEKRLETAEKKLAEYEAKRNEKQAKEAIDEIIKKPGEKKKVLGQKNKIVTLEEFQRLREKVREWAKSAGIDPPNKMGQHDQGQK
ncbi:MAG: hypothetical protein ABFD75_02250 [Smithella sp.]